MTPFKEADGKGTEKDCPLPPAKGEAKEEKGKNKRNPDPFERQEEVDKRKRFPDGPGTRPFTKDQDFTKTDQNVDKALRDAKNQHNIPRNK